MGIPFFYRDIVTKNRNVLTNVRGCDRLFLDFNGIIHPCSAKVMASMEGRGGAITDRNQRIFKAITDYTDYVVAQCPPTRLLYIAIDGVAPLAKMVQQRKRRHMTAYRNGRIAEFKRKHQMPVSDWDSNCITPGTTFMEELNAYLHAYYREERPYTVIVSGPGEHGEGEHKILHYIRKQSPAGEREIECARYKDVIYGLDADLIMLALTCPAQNQIFLMRESQEFGGKHVDMVTFKYVNMDAMRHHVSVYLQGEGGDSQAYMNDYVCLGFFLGNDFLPHPSFMSIKHHCVDLLCEVYKEARPVPEAHLVERGERGWRLNTTFLANILEALAKREDDRMKSIVKEYHEARIPNTAHLQDKMARFLAELETMPLKNRRRDIDPEADPLWRNAYFYHMLNIHPYHERERMDDVCAAFLQGLHWNIDYYFNHVFSHAWYYPYPFAPTFRDMHHYVLKCGAGTRAQVDGDLHIAPHEQLMLVLPVQSKGLLPGPLQALMASPEGGCAHFYPTTFHIEGFLKHQLWECTPILPTLNVPYLKKKIQEALVR